MASLTLSMPLAIKERMSSFKFINWSEIAREAIISKIHLLERMNKLFSKNTLAKEDTIKYGSMIKKRQWQKTKKFIS